VEKALATRLRTAASHTERQSIYRTMYADLFERVPDHPRIQIREDSEAGKYENLCRLKFVERFLDTSTTFVEFGPGDCQFLMSICPRVKFAYGVDIGDQRGAVDCTPNNFKLIVYNGYDLDLRENSVDVVFSDQLIEHFHPEDTIHHFQTVKNILKPGGRYIFCTPHRLTGPHDISRYFSETPEGFHLKEWTFKEIGELLNSLGYASWQSYLKVRTFNCRWPLGYFTTVEGLLLTFPRRARKILSSICCPGVSVVAIK
jgi:SAM-dependent methyltransferase